MMAKPTERGCSRLIERSETFGTGLLGARRGRRGKTMSASKLRQRKFRHSKQMVSTQLSAWQNAWQRPWRNQISNPNSTERRKRSFWKPQRPRLSGITPDIPTKFPGMTGHGTLENVVVGVEVVDSLDGLLHFVHGETPPPVDIQNADQQRVDLVGNRENGRGEAGEVLEVGVEGGIADGG